LANSLAGEPTALRREFGAAGAVYPETALGGGDRVGISSWSSTVLAAVDAMAPRTVRPIDAVVQVLGGGRYPARSLSAR
jgi:DNA-binding transcriptional regulator LsrR (DeoR family)